MREGAGTSFRSQDAIVQALCEITGEAMPRSAVFEPQESALLDLLSRMVADTPKRVRSVTDRLTLADLLAAMKDEEFEASIEQLRALPTGEAAIRELFDAGEVLLDRNPKRANAIYALAAAQTVHLVATPAPLAHALRGFAEKGRAKRSG
jgi:hypothetical protein